MIFGRKKLCIFCGRCLSYELMHTVYKGIGICSECYSDLLTTKDKSFEGREHIKMLLAPFFYYGSMRRVVRKFKFSDQELYGELLGKMLSEELSVHKWISEYDCIIPVPLHENRLKEREYNQSEILSHAISKDFRVSVCEDYLMRVKDTQRQSSLKGIDRKENVKNAFYADKKNVMGKRIILIDDIYTMGETIDACAKELKAKVAKDVLAITLCKTPQKEINEYFDLIQ